MYEVINEKLKLEACGIGDLTLETVSGMLKQWNDGSSISTLTVFYVPARDTVVINRDHVNYDTYKALGLVDYNKYTVTNALAGDVNLPSIGGFIPVVSDRFTVDTSKQNVVYKTYMIGAGSILTCLKNNYEDPYYADYDPETKAGIRKLYTKQGYVLHPNGFSIDQNKVAKESPTNAELGNKANWSLVYNQKNIRMGMIKSNG